MTTLSNDEIDRFEHELSSYPEALAALTKIRECGGNVEDATTVILMKESGWDPVQAEWLDRLADRSRELICQKYVKSSLPNLFAGLLNDLPVLLEDILGVPIPAELAAKLITGFVIRLLSKTTLEKLCQPPKIQ
jgi:hypothetical protein